MTSQTNNIFLGLCLVECRMRSGTTSLTLSCLTPYNHSNKRYPFASPLLGSHHYYSNPQVLPLPVCPRWSQHAPDCNSQCYALQLFDGSVFLSEVGKHGNPSSGLLGFFFEESMLRKRTPSKSQILPSQWLYHTGLYNLLKQTCHNGASIIFWITRIHPFWHKHQVSIQQTKEIFDESQTDDLDIPRILRPSFSEPLSPEPKLRLPVFLEHFWGVTFTWGENRDGISLTGLIQPKYFWW